MKKRILAIAILAVSTLIFAEGKTKTDAQWLKTKYKKLAAIKDPAKVNNIGLRVPKDKGHDDLYMYFPKGNGRIVFVDKSWILLVSHSSHAEDGIGDLTLIRASDGKCYVNKGYVCDKLILETKEKIVSLETFLKSTGKGPKAEPIEWKEYQGELD